MEASAASTAPSAPRGSSEAHGQRAGRSPVAQRRVSALDREGRPCTLPGPAVTRARRAPPRVSTRPKRATLRPLSTGGSSADGSGRCDERIETRESPGGCLPARRWCACQTDHEDDQPGIESDRHGAEVLSVGRSSCWPTERTTGDPSSSNRRCARRGDRLGMNGRNAPADQGTVCAQPVENRVSLSTSAAQRRAGAVDRRSPACRS